MEPDVSRSLAHPARFPLRPASPRIGPECCRKKICSLSERFGRTRRLELSLRRNVGRGHDRPHVHWWRGCTSTEESEGRIAWRGLQDRERALPFCPGLQRGELEPEFARTADTAGRRCKGGRLFAGSGMARGPATGGGLQLL